MRRYRLTLFLHLAFAASAFAQDKQPVYFRHGSVITNPDSADYYRVLNSQNDESFNFTEYHNDGSRIEASATGSLSDPVYRGIATYYYKTGKVAIKKEYSGHGSLLKTEGYYPNGVLMYVTYHQGVGSGEVLGYDADSSGNAHVINGNGVRQETDSVRLAGEHFTMKGPYKDGLKEGVWKGSDDKGLRFEQSFLAGRFVSGTATSNVGKKYHYTKLFEYPRFKGDFDKFNRSILANLKNPTDTLNLEFLKPGILHLSYVINERGEVTALKGFRKNGHVMVGLELKSDEPICRPARLRGVPIPFIVADNRVTPAGFRPFNTDIYLRGQIIFPDNPYLKH
ncbi:MAG: hypothetical protein M3N14_00600 [Bacteroidota bacterium]|nr:hypothetical protein [Bacteroidota bacterium]